MANLISFVHVMNAEGRSQVFGPGDDLPDWAREQITNPKAWDESFSVSAVIQAQDEINGAALDQATAAELDITKPIEAILAWVGEDPERALEAFAVEQARGGSARQTLLAKLEALVG